MRASWDNFWFILVGSGRARRWIQTRTLLYCESFISIFLSPSNTTLSMLRLLLEFADMSRAWWWLLSFISVVSSAERREAGKIAEALAPLCRCTLNMFNRRNDLAFYCGLFRGWFRFTAWREESLHPLQSDGVLIVTKTAIPRSNNSNIILYRSPFPPRRPRFLLYANCISFPRILNALVAVVGAPVKDFM